MKRLTLVIAAGALALGLAACSSASAGQPAPTGPAAGGSAAGSATPAVVVSARGLKFEQQQVTAPAGIPFALEFDNHDSAPHNVAIVGPDGAAVFSGDVFGGDGSKVYDVPALKAGTYTFRCDVHPDMTGTLTVR
jgi:plastocyanin